MHSQNELLSEFNALRAQNPTIRTVDAAARLGSSEGQILEARTGGGHVARLAGKGPDLFNLVEDLRDVGRVMTLTRNASVVHETKGPIQDTQAHGVMAQVVGPVDLRLFMRHWHAAYHVTDETKSGLRKSFQIYDPHGTSVLKIFATDRTDGDLWMVVAQKHADQSDTAASFEPADSKPADRPDGDIDVETLRQRWRSLEHSHDFFRILKDLGVGRRQALRLAGADLAEPLDRAAIRTMLDGASADAIPIMCFVGNPGCVQIYSGPITQIAEMGPWLNVMDPDFNLHMRMDLIDQTWLVRKPTGLRGMITSLELFDAAGEMVCQFFGARPPGEQERADWQALANALARKEMA